MHAFFASSGNPPAPVRPNVMYIVDKQGLHRRERAAQPRTNDLLPDVSDTPLLATTTATVAARSTRHTKPPPPQSRSRYDGSQVKPVPSLRAAVGARVREEAAARGRAAEQLAAEAAEQRRRRAEAAEELRAARDVRSAERRAAETAARAEATRELERERRADRRAARAATTQKEARSRGKAQVRQSLVESIAERAQWRADVARRRLSEERELSARDLTEMEDEFLAVERRRRERQADERETREQELQMKREQQRRTRKVERRAELHEASFVERIGRREERLQREKECEAREVGLAVRAQIEEKELCRRELRRQELLDGREAESSLRMDRPLPETTGAAGTAAATAAKQGKGTSLSALFPIPTRYRDHGGRTLYRWGLAG